MSFNYEELEVVKKKALEEHIPIIMDDTLEKIEEILKKENPKRILDCIIDTIELNEERAKEARENVEKIGIADRINIIIGNAVEILPTLNDKYDVVFIDANKGKYPVFLQEAIRLLKNDGVILADNILYKGYVMSDYNKHKQRTAVRHLREYIAEITGNENLDSEILDIGDGLAITRVKKVNKD